MPREAKRRVDRWHGLKLYHKSAFQMNMDFSFLADGEVLKDLALSTSLKDQVQRQRIGVHAYRKGVL